MAEPDLSASSGAQALNKVSFLNWGAPVMIAWAAVCLVFAEEHGLCSPTIESMLFLFMIYIIIYLTRTNYLLLDKSIFEKMASSILVVITLAPSLYVFPGLLWRISVIPFLVVNILLGGTYFYTAVPTAIGWPILVISFGTVCGLLLSLLERIVVGRTATWRHVLGCIATGLLAIPFMYEVEGSAPRTMLAIGLLIALPVPHLLIVWRARFKLGVLHGSRFTARRGLAYAVGVGTVVYVGGIARFVPEHGWNGLAWPQAVLAQAAIDHAHRIVLSAPQGRGTLPIGGRSYLIPAEFTAGQSALWSKEAREYSSVDLRVPYARWITESDLGELTRAGDIDQLAYAEITLHGGSPNRRDRLESITALCAPSGIHGLRRCFAPDREVAELAAMGIDPNDLEPVRLEGWYRPLDDRDVLALGDYEHPDAARVDTVSSHGTGAFVARCYGWGPDESDLAPPRSMSGWRSNCVLEFNVGSGLARVQIYAEYLPFWRQIQAGVLADIAAWRAAAEGAEPIEAVAEREAKVPLLYGFDRLMVAVVGWEWNMSRGFRTSSQRCR